jgi:cis-3-alkyl-4-acyloxetan-2-one decarboxylase
MDDEGPQNSVDNTASTVLPPDLARLYPFARHFHRLPDGQRMHYIDVGSGPVVVMLHGNPTWSWMYRNLALALADGFRCIVPDHIGCGFSDKPQDYPYTLAQHIRNVRSLLDRLGIKHFDLVAHDWGGAIGMGLAGRSPGEVGRIALMNTAAFQGDMPMRIAVCKVPYLGAFLVRGMNAFASGAVRMACQRPLPRDVARGFVWPYRNWHDRVATLRFVQDAPLSNSHPSYAELARVERSLADLVDKPMLLCWGMRDFCFTPRYLAEWRQRFPKAEAIEYKQAGHYVLEDESEQVTTRISDFLRGR